MDFENRSISELVTGEPSPEPAAALARPPSQLESHILGVADDLVAAVRVVVAEGTERGAGPVAIARSLRIDKVLASRVLKALRMHDPMSAAYAMPGPDPLRRFVRAAARCGASPVGVSRAEATIDAFERLIRDQIGDRSLLDAVLTASIPDARREFELRRKQAAFKAISQLKGLQARAILATVFLAPSDDDEHMDVVWVNGVAGLHRVRPGAVVKLTTRRMAPTGASRSPSTLDGHEITEPGHLCLTEFCSKPMPTIDVRQSNEVMTYTLGGEAFGAQAAVDLVFVEVNRRELKRRVPLGTKRLSYVFAEITPPAEVVQFDVVVHESLFAGQDPTLRIYDASFDGVANPNDPSRDVDRYDLLEASESIERLGAGLRLARSNDVPRYLDLTGTVFDRMGWRAPEFRGYRCRIVYPVYGSQVLMAFRAVEADH